MNRTNVFDNLTLDELGAIAALVMGQDEALLDLLFETIAKRMDKTLQGRYGFEPPPQPERRQ